MTSIRLGKQLRLNISGPLRPGSFRRDRDNMPLHAPKTWPLWRLFWLRLCRLSVVLPSTGYRVWFYTRHGATYLDFYFDRRDHWWKRAKR